ncbi:hypothetical protein Fmac_001865 [Flemingia macrophylla]|uniref:Uncharacterized protein n=1 Tax=Flemingia macrophylla TaxID=520843 RepID=A0ABD1NIB2_9FABA
MPVHEDLATSLRESPRATHLPEGDWRAPRAIRHHTSRDCSYSTHGPWWAWRTGPTKEPTKYNTSFEHNQPEKGIPMAMAEAKLQAKALEVLCSNDNTAMETLFSHIYSS